MRAARQARVALGVALVSACLGVATSDVQAAPPVTVLSGLLTVSVVPPAATLSTSGSTVSGSLGTSTIIDGRLGATGYDVTVTSSGFQLVGATSQTSASFITGTAASVAVTATSGGTASTTAYRSLPATPLFRLSYPGSVSLVNLTSTYTLSLSLTVPGTAATGRWTGTVTQTVA